MERSLENLAQWMTLLPEPIKHIPIINLAIPGSHDSMSYGISRMAKVAPDAEPVVNHLYKVLPCVVRRWAITQKLNALEQLNNGIRYLDLRICMQPKNFNFYFVHGLYCEEITEPLREIRKFMDEHPNEFIIIDCQHFYNFSNGDYDRLNKILFKIFQDKFFTQTTGPLTKVTIDWANSLKKQLLVVYRYSQVPKEFWPGDCWPTPWPNQINVKKLEAVLDTNIKYRSANTGYVSQCVLTPPVKFIVPRFYSSLKKKCAVKVCKKLTDWIKVQRPGPFSLNANQPTSNVFIADFIELKNFQFCRTVIALNGKIFNDLITKSDSLPMSCNKGSDAKDLNDQQHDDKKDYNESNNTTTIES
ncbi:PI-PLC X domain-containing protein 3 isoform X3 [Sitodiplosis mosellana]|nr:PI-PLC X domain-containing protein 3 isoform X3 [Sitodiplosis mosellana]XP_055297284.1 PI-PLC X domain-containing protein 3 isoform X3 [Sitodiplosis mosellana]